MISDRVFAWIILTVVVVGIVGAIAASQFMVLGLKLVFSPATGGVP